MMNRLAALLLLAITALSSAQADDILKIGSKKFTESVILADIATDLARSAGARVEHRQELGGTRILWSALLAGDIDIYPEYTGTLTQEILADEHLTDAASLERALAAHGIRMSRSLGFSDTYALGMMPKRAEQDHIVTISDLAGQRDLHFGLSNEFLSRQDGWPSLQQAYGLQGDVRGLDHDVAYRALAAGSIDVVDLYTTDAEIASYGIRVLADDRRHFPDYDAVLLYRAGLETRQPAALKAILNLEGHIDTTAMIAMNHAVQLDHRPETTVAGDFVRTQFGITAAAQDDGLAARVLQRTLEHLTLTVISLAAAIFVSLPLGIIAARHRRTGHVILTFAGILQTIPSLALLVFMIPLLGIGGAPAIVALFLYSLLPIVRNTSTGLAEIPLPIQNTAIVLGLSPLKRLLRIELPLALPSILAGIKTAAVINVGTATLGALIGAGGYGQPILAGIRLNNAAMILEGAIPAALLALLVQALFDIAERYLVPRGLRLRPNQSV